MNIHIKKTQSAKPDLVLLHGWGTSSDIWQPWLPFLTEHYSITCIDLPGLGLSTVSDSENYSLQSVVSALADKVPDNSILLGWSLGGMLAIALAQKLQLRIKALVTIACNPCFVQRDDWTEAMSEDDFAAFEANLVRQPKKTLSRFFLLQVQNGSQQKAVLNHLRAVDKNIEHQQLCASLQLLKHDLRQSLGQLGVPSLHFYAEMDQLVPRQVRHLIGAMGINITGLEIPEAGHLPFISDPQWLADELVGFAQRIDAGRY